MPEPAPGIRRRPVAHRVLAAARALGVEDTLRAAQRTFEPPRQRRARQDDLLLGAVLAAVLAPDATYVDVGASVGDVLAHAVRLAPAGRHVAFEPFPEVAAALRERFPGVTVHQAAVGAARGTAEFELVREDPALSSLRPGAAPRPGAETVAVDVVTLDEALPEDLAPALVKIDVEGAELDVLRGAAGVIARHRPVVVLEHRARHAMRFGTTARAVHDQLTALGLRVFDLEGAGPLDAARFGARVARDTRWNFLARV